MDADEKSFELGGWIHFKANPDEPLPVYFEVEPGGGALVFVFEWGGRTVVFRLETGPAEYAQLRKKYSAYGVDELDVLERRLKKELNPDPGGVDALWRRLMQRLDRPSVDAPVEQVDAYIKEAGMFWAPRLALEIRLLIVQDLLNIATLGTGPLVTEKDSVPKAEDQARELMGDFLSFPRELIIVGYTSLIRRHKRDEHICKRYAELIRSGEKPGRAREKVSEEVSGMAKDKGWEPLKPRSIETIVKDMSGYFS